MSILVERTPDAGAAGSGPEALDLKPLEKFYTTLGVATRLSVAVLLPEGRLAGGYSHPEDPLHSTLVDRPELVGRLLEGATSDPDGCFVAKGPGGLRLSVAPVVVDGREIARVVLGPAWGEDPEPRAVAEFSGQDPEDLKGALAGRPQHGDAWLLDTVRSLGELAGEVLAERARQRRNLSKLQALSEVVAEIGSSLDLGEVLQKVLDRAISLLEATNGSLMLLDEVNSELRILVAHGLDDTIVATTRVKLGEGISGWVAQEGRPRLLAGGVRDEGSLKGKGATLPSAMCVPLTVKNHTLGVLNISRQGRDFTEQDLQFLSGLAGVAASAIERAQLYERVRRQLGELEGLHRVGQALNSSLDLEATLHEVLDQALALMGAEAASVMLLDELSEELYIRIARGLPEDVVRDTRVKLGERISGEVALEGTARLLARGKRADGREIASALCVPLKAAAKVIGVLNIRGKDDGRDFDQEDLQLASRLASMSAAAIENAGLHEELNNLFIDAIKALANAIDARDPYTRGHSERVTEYTVMIAEEMGYEGEELEYIRYASLLHDIGKIRIRDHILNKPGRLTDEEFAEMKLHPEYGVEIMRPVKAFQRVLPYMLYHHERFSGGGYPHGLAGEDIPLPARQMCVADCFDAMTSDRPYRKGMEVEKALAELEKNSGSQFDPKVVEAFLSLVGKGRVHPVVESQREEKEPSEQLIGLVDRYGRQSARSAARRPEASGSPPR